MRSTDSYVTAMLFRVVAQRAAKHGERAQQSATLFFGQLLVLATLSAGLLAVLLVDARAIGCVLDGTDAASLEGDRLFGGGDADGERGELADDVNLTCLLAD